MLLRFEAENLKTPNPSVSATFKHVGSLFHIALKNTGIDLTKITKAELFATTDIQAHRNSENATYNPVTGTFSETTTTGTSLTFEINSTNLPVNNIMDFWGWYAPVAEDNWPSLGLKITATGGPYTCSNTKAARTEATAIGKAYHFYAAIEGGFLNFTGPNFNPYGELLDDRDGDSYTYKTITIGDQTWMAENLRYLPEVHKKTEGSTDSPRYYVYNYNDNSVSDAKTNVVATINYYETYGVLYNYPAALTACPPGWHLPSEAEWIDLETFLSYNGYRYDGKIGPQGSETVRDNIAKSLASVHTNWAPYQYATDGSPSKSTYPSYQNKSGFTALPGGQRYSNDFQSVKEDGFWWTATEKEGSNTYWVVFRLPNYRNYTERLDRSKDYGFSIRCVKD